MTKIIITIAEYLLHSGKNLDLEFANGNSDSGVTAGTIYLKNVSLETYDYLRSHYIIKDVVEDAEFISEYKRGLCLQVDYLLGIGDGQLNTNLGIQKLAPKARNVFQMLALCNNQESNDVNYWGY